MTDKLEEQKEVGLNFGEIKKCAIFVHYSINDTNRIEEKKTKLIKFCEDILHTNNYEVFIEIGSFLGEREVFNDMLKKFENGEFSHLVVTNVGQIYKLSYDMSRAIYLTNLIQSLNVSTICVDEEKLIKGKNKLRDIER